MNRTIMVISVTVVLIIIIVTVFVLIGGSKENTSSGLIHVETRTENLSIRQTRATNTTITSTPIETETQTPPSTVTIMCQPLFYVNQIIFKDEDFSVELDLRANVEQGCIIYVNKVYLVKLSGEFNKTLLDEPISVGGGQALPVPLNVIYLEENEYIDFKEKYERDYALIIIYYIVQQGVEETVSLPLKTIQLSQVL
uniref:Uncharacterized protein n=1 Tax=Staphylothermus marinus TaxID=2280 RepID=A0A7C4NMY7_STAMA